MRSKHTGQVGSSIRDGVGGARGFEFRVVEVTVADGGGSALKGNGVKGSLFMSGNELESAAAGILVSTDLMNTTWQFSGCDSC